MSEGQPSVETEYYRELGTVEESGDYDPFTIGTTHE